MPSPSFDRFQELAQEYQLVPVFRRLLSDALTPVSAFHLLDDGVSAACLFESVIGGEKVGRYSFIAVSPNGRITARANEVCWTSADGTETKEKAQDPLDSLWSAVSGRKVAVLPELPPLTGGAIGYASYDVVRYVEALPNAPEDDRNLPDLDFSLFDDLVIFDHVTKSLFVVAHVHCDQFDSVESAYTHGVERLDHLTKKLQQPSSSLPVTDFASAKVTDVEPKSNFTQQEFEQAVEKCTEYIRAGDIFQVVISQRMEIPAVCDPFEVYRTLRVVNPSPFMFFVRTPETTLVGSSPEVMCRVIDGVVTVRPLAGTRPRGKTTKEDLALAEELLADPNLGAFAAGLPYAKATFFVDESKQRQHLIDAFDAVRLTGEDPCVALNDAAALEQELLDEFWANQE